MTNQNTATRDTAAAKHSMNSSNYSLWPVSQKENKHLLDTELERTCIYPNFTFETFIGFCSRRVVV